MKRPVYLLIMTALLLWTLPAAADHSASGTVSGPTPYVYTIKCNPGERFLVEVTSTQPTSVNILSMTPDSRADGGWAFNAVKSSQKAYSHLLDHSAPSGEPKNNASHWHYRVSILASTHEAADFTLSVSQFPGDSKKPEGNDKQTRKQLDDLLKSMVREFGELEARFTEMEWVKAVVKDLNERHKTIIEAKEKIKQLDDAIRSETDPQAKERLRETRRAIVAENNPRIKEYNADFLKNKGDIEMWNSMLRRYNAINDLGNSIMGPYESKDYASCVAIANGSDIARELGWVNIGK